MTEVPPEFILVLKMLIKNEVDFVLVGGLAMIAQGTDTITQDLDISFAVADENCEKICDLLNAHHPRPLAFPPNTNFTVTPGLLRRVKFPNLKTDLGPIDLLPLPDGIGSFAGLKARADIKDMGDFSVAVASIVDLIAMKRAANRPKDQTHLLELYALQRVLAENLDAQ